MQHINTDSHTAKVVIIGAGIIGMTTAYQMLKQGYQNVKIISKDPPLETNSDVAAALWRPYGANPAKDALAWSEQSYSEFFDIYYDYLKLKAKKLNYIQPMLNPGITFVVDVEYFGPEGFPKPDWMLNADKLLEDKMALLLRDSQSDIAHVRSVASKLLEKLEEQKAKMPEILAAAKLDPSRPEMYASVVPIIDSTLYRKWLLMQYEKTSKMKVEVREEGIKSLEQGTSDLEMLAQEYDVIINCAGEQARHLISDAHTQPIRGVVAITQIPKELNYCIGVEPNPDLDNGQIKISYAIIRPSSGTCVMGGTYEEMADSQCSSEEKKQSDVQDIFKRMIHLIPGMRNENDIRIITIKEGFRCGREEIYSEVKKMNVNGKWIIYAGALGHGGGGYSVSHGVGRDMAKKCSAALFTLKEEIGGEISRPKQGW